MSAEYKLVFRDRAGAKVHETMDFLELAYQRRVNEPGLLKFRLGSDHPFGRQIIAAPRSFVDYQVEVWRRNVAQNLAWYVDFYGFYQSTVVETKKTTTITATVPGIMNVLARRVVAYPAGTANRSEFISVAAETVMKTLVAYNASQGIATNLGGRDMDGAFTSFNVVTASDVGRGPSVTWGGSRKNLLTELQRIADATGFYFDVLRTGPKVLTFEVYAGLRGIDRSADVVFSLNRGNMANPKVEYTPYAAGAVIAGGSGERGDREVVVAGISADERPELFVDGRNEPSVAALTERAWGAYHERKGRDVLTFDVVQTSVSYYGKHYGLGDWVTAEYAGLSARQTVVGVSVAVKNGAEDIQVETK